jgi:cytochrome c556
VNAETKAGPKPNVFQYKFNFANISPERSCQVIFMGVGPQWTISPSGDGGDAVRKEGTASVTAGTMVSLVVPIYWTISGAPVPHQVFYDANGMDTSWITENLITLQYTGPSYRSISVKLRIVDHTNSGGKKVTVMRNDEALLDGVSAAVNTTNSNWSGQVSDGETIWLTTSEPGMVVTTAPTNGVVSADNTNFEYVVVFYGDGGPPVDPPEPPVNPPEPPVNPPEPPVNPPEPPPEPPEPPEPPVVDPPPPPVDPPEPPTEDPGSDVLEAINNLQKALIADGDATRKLTAEGFNKVLAELHNGTITNAEGLRRVVEAVQNNEYAVREEAYKTRVVNADGFNKMIAAINANGFDDSRIVGAVNEVRDEVKKINDRFDEAEEESSGNKDKFEEAGQGVREAADSLGNSMGEILDNLKVNTSGDVSSVESVDYVQVGKHKITFNPFSSILGDSSMAVTLRACRKLITWAIVVGLFIEVAIKISVLLADLMKTGSKSSVGGQILAPGLGGTLGVVLGTVLALVGLVVSMTVVLTLPVLALAIYTSVAVQVPIGEVISSSPITILNEAAANNPKIAHALWYANQIIPVALCVFAPAYRLLLVHVIIPGKFVAQVLFRFFPF